jgi:hypothetical protein
MGKQRYRLERVQHIAHSRDTVFAFFADAGNLELLTPDFLHFRILTPRPIVMQPGTLIDYQLRLFSVPIRWRTRIDVYEPPTRFTDVQLLGPYCNGITCMRSLTCQAEPWWLTESTMNSRLAASGYWHMDWLSDAPSSKSSITGARVLNATLSAPLC